VEQANQEAVSHTIGNGTGIEIALSNGYEINRITFLPLHAKRPNKACSYKVEISDGKSMKLPAISYGKKLPTK